jgi:hypothetical protein
MKRIRSYTLGWDTVNKEGYISIVDENDKRHVFKKIATQEFSMMLMMLQRGDAFLDNQNWLISGWAG